jgi:predicted Zn-dependent protease
LSRGASKVRGLLWVLLAAVLAAGAALALPWAARRVPWSVERGLGDAVGFLPPGQPCSGQARASALFDALVARIYPVLADDADIPLKVEVIHGKTVNAFAALGGRVYVFEGLIDQARSPEELAGVLAHEIEHVRNRHVIQGVAVDLLTLEGLRLALPGDPQDTRLAHLLLNLQFSRGQEAEADEKGLERLRRAQVDAAGFEQFFARAQAAPAPPQFLSSHPSNEARRALAARLRGYPVRPVLEPGQWEVLSAICR